MGRESSGRRHRKRKQEKEDTDSAERLDDGDRSRSPDKKSRRVDDDRQRDRDASNSPTRNTTKSRRLDDDRQRDRDASDSPTRNATNEESLSIEETNRLRASLGLAPLEVDDGPKVKESAGGEPGERVLVEDGMEFVHKAPEHIGEKKKADEMREKIQTSREKRRLESKMLKVKGLAESDSEEDTAAWVKRNREIDEERKRAEQRAKLLDDMDAEFGVDSLLLEEKQRKQKTAESRRLQKNSDLAGFLVGHSKEQFVEGRETVLVLEDRGVLEDGEEVLVNPNLIENKRSEKNAELRRRKDRYEPYREDLDELGMAKSQSLLSKYDEELYGEDKQTFRLDESGEVDLEKDRQEMEIRRNLLMANKKLVSLDMPAYKVASEFYSQEEMIAFRKPKKKTGAKIRKRKQKILKADDLLADMEPETDVPQRSLSRQADRRQRGTVVKEEPFGNDEAVKQPNGVGEEALEEGECVDAVGLKEKWQSAPTSGFVDVQQLNKFVENEVDEDSDEESVGGIDLAGVLIDDDAEEELSSMLDHARKLRHLDAKKEDGEAPDSAIKVREMLVEHIKSEPVDADDVVVPVSDKGVVIDSTMEYCRNLGEIPTYGLAGNRKDAIDVSELKGPEEERRVKEEEDFDEQTPRRRGRGRKGDDDSEDDFEEAVRESRRKGNAKGKWLEASATTSALVDDPSSSFWRRRTSDTDSESDDEVYNVLGEERDVTKGVAAMLKLAGEKGYLDDGRERRVNGPSLKHLESKRFSQIESGRYDIEEKYTKKLERMGTTGTGPIRPFPEKGEYKPNIQITYIDQRGREMEPKDAFRVLSWKFHGKGPGKKQIEKRQAKVDKKELMKKMNSMDTPLGTLGKQLKKQESLQTPYIILSGSGRDTGAPLKKE